MYIDRNMINLGKNIKSNSIYNKNKIVKIFYFIVIIKIVIVTIKLK